MPQLVIFDTDVLIDAGRRIDDAISCLQRAEQKATLVATSRSLGP